MIESVGEYFILVYKQCKNGLEERYSLSFCIHYHFIVLDYENVIHLQKSKLQCLLFLINLDMHTFLRVEHNYRQTPPTTA